MRKRSVEERFKAGKYLASATKTIPRMPDVNGVPIVPLEGVIATLAKLHSSMQRTIQKAQGEAKDYKAKLHQALYQQQRTQEYIKAMQGRIEQAAADGIQVSTFVEQEHERVRAYRANGKKGGVFASEPE